MFNLDKFIAQHVTKREHSMFLDDIEANKEILSSRIKGKSVLVIGGAPLVPPLSKPFSPFSRLL